MAITAAANSDFSVQVSYTHRAIVRDFEFVHGFEISRARAREARRIHLCTLMRVFAHAYYKLGFDNT